MFGMEPAPERRPEISVLFDVWLLMHLVSGVLDQALAEHGLSGDEFGLYSLLRGFGPVTPTQIARWTGMPATTVSAALRRLTTRGHLERVPHPDDGRSYLVALSHSGVAAHAGAASSFLAAAGSVSDALGDDERVQRAALQRLDHVMRSIAGLDPRPYQVTESSPGTPPALTYSGHALTPAQEHQARRYIDFIRRSE
jgi:DNA-binding MarR family transcriptional regulator